METLQTQAPDYLTPQAVNQQIAYMEGQFAHTPDVQSAWEVGHTSINSLVQIETQDPDVAREARRARRKAENALVDAQLDLFSPFNQENDYDTESRSEAATYAHSLAEQSQTSGIPLTAAHARFAKRLADGEITREAYDEATFRIAARFALYNPESLTKQEAAQHAANDAKIQAGELPADTPKVSLVSHATKDGVRLGGIEAVLAKRAGAKSHEEWTQKLRAWQKSIFDKERLTTAGKIMQRHQQTLAGAVAFQVGEYNRIHDSLKHLNDDEDDNEEESSQS